MEGSFFMTPIGYPYRGLMKGLTSEGLVGAIAERTLLGVLAGAEVDRAVRFSRERDRRESRTLMSAIAEGLVLAVTAGAPVVGLTGLDEDREGRLLRDVGGGHGLRVSTLDYGV
jgi:hypothetical protein